MRIKNLKKIQNIFVSYLRKKYKYNKIELYKIINKAHNNNNNQQKNKINKIINKIINKYINK